MKKIIMLIILAMTVVSCGLLSPQLWDEARERREERGERCYKQYGNVYCEDKNGNRIY